MTDIDEALRTMLRERAADITTVPADFNDLDSLDVLNGGSDDAEHHRAHWWLFVAAAAIVALIVGVTAALRDHDDHRPAPPATNHPHPSPAPTAKSLPACLTTAPPSWRTALAAASTLGATSAFPFAISSNGTMVATRDFGAARDVVVIPPGGTPRKIFDVPEPNLKQAFQASIEGDWVLVSVALLPRKANGVDASVMDLVLVNTATNSTRTIAQVSSADWQDGKKTINGAVMALGHIYWDVKPTYASKTGTIQDYDIATGRQSTLATGLVDAPVAHPNRVTWAGGTIENAELPPVIAHVVARDPGAAQSLVSDGSAYAWISRGRIGWWASGATEPVEMRPPPVTTEPQKFNSLLVAGQYVFVFQYSEHGSVRRLIDMRTGAIAHTTVDLQYGGGGVFGAYTGPSDTEVLRVDTATLPKLHC